MEPRFGHDFSQVRVHTDAKAAESAQAVNARAYAVGSHVVFDRNDNPLTTEEVRQVLAHELAHVVQQSHSQVPTGLVIGQVNSDEEREADRVAAQVVHGSGFENGMRHVGRKTLPAQVQRKDSDEAKEEQPQTPYDKVVVERAKKRLRLLKRYVDEYTVREARRQASKSERDAMLKKRKKMDTEGFDPFAELQPRGEMEQERMAHLSKLPLRIDVTEDQVKFWVNFHIRFEDPKQESSFDKVKTSLKRGIDLVWNQTLAGDIFGKRKFIIEPQVVKVSTTAARDLNYWLITVRATDTGSVNYPGCRLDQPPPGVPTSVTDPSCDGGVMSIPPSHIGMPDVLGHELLHLFGFLDRYLSLTSQSSSGKTTVRLESTRETHGRPDPLGAETGHVLTEDIALLFDRLGVYQMEENRGLDTLHKIEGEGLSLGAVLGEMERLEEIIKLGRDPHSLIRIRKDFTDRMIQDAEDL